MRRKVALFYFNCICLAVMVQSYPSLNRERNYPQPMDLGPGHLDENPYILASERDPDMESWKRMDYGRRYLGKRKYDADDNVNDNDISKDLCSLCNLLSTKLRTHCDQFCT